MLHPQEDERGREPGAPCSSQRNFCPSGRRVQSPPAPASSSCQLEWGKSRATPVGRDHSTEHIIQQPLPKPHLMLSALCACQHHLLPLLPSGTDAWGKPSFPSTWIRMNNYFPVSPRSQKGSPIALDIRTGWTAIQKNPPEHKAAPLSQHS